MGLFRARADRDLLHRRTDKDMIAIPIGPKLRMAAVASPAYFARHPLPKTAGDRPRHRCIRQRQVGGGVYAWEFERRGRELEVRVEGVLVHLRHERTGDAEDQISPSS